VLPHILPHILIVDDDRHIREMLGRFLIDHGLRVSEARDGFEMRQRMIAARPDLVVLDVMLPGDDGFTLCARLRATSAVPVILLTARGGDTDRVVGLELGADDYVAKPFNPRELLARIRAVLRRTGRQADGPVDEPKGVRCFAGWKLDTRRRTLLSPENILTELTSGEFDLLAALVENPQRVMSRDQLLDLVHGRASINIDRSIDVQVSRLRRKIEENPAAPLLIKTVRNGGYFFTATVTEEDGQSSDNQL
jgi:two-component system OmpR family response regulator